MIEIETPHGPARAHLQPAEEPRGLLILGHGAGGGVGAPDLTAAAETAVAAGVSVALIEQPYRVAGRRSPAPAHQLDAAWTAVVAAVRGDVPVLCGGRSSGARVACRTAAATGAAGVLCLAFPLHPPGRPEKTRLGELEAVRVPVLDRPGRERPVRDAARERNPAHPRGRPPARQPQPALRSRGPALRRPRLA